MKPKMVGMLASLPSMDAECACRLHGRRDQGHCSDQPRDYEVIVEARKRKSK